MMFQMLSTLQYKQDEKSEKMKVRVEQISIKGEIARFEQFHLLL